MSKYIKEQLDKLPRVTHTLGHIVVFTK